MKNLELGRLGGLKGGEARAKKLTPEQRSSIARKAAYQRWGKDVEESQETPSEKIQEALQKNIQACVYRIRTCLTRRDAAMDKYLEAKKAFDFWDVRLKKEIDILADYEKSLSLKA